MQRANPVHSYTAEYSTPSGAVANTDVISKSPPGSTTVGSTAPLWAAMARLVPQLKPCEAMLLDNTALWQQLADGKPLEELETSQQLALCRAWEEQPLLGFGVSVCP